MTGIENTDLKSELFKTWQKAKKKTVKDCRNCIFHTDEIQALVKCADCRPAFKNYKEAGG